MFKSRFIVSILMCLLFNLHGWHRRGKGIKWGVTSQMVAIAAHSFCRNKMKAHAISLGAIGLLYGWDNMVNDYYEPQHKKNGYYIAGGYMVGWFCGTQLRSVLGL